MTIKHLRHIFSHQIRYDRRHHNENSYNFKPFLKYMTPNIQGKLAVETGKVYRKDIQDENNLWFHTEDLSAIDANYIKWLHSHQHHFKLNCIYPMADDIDETPKPLTHWQFWLYLNHRPQEAFQNPVPPEHHHDTEHHHNYTVCVPKESVQDLQKFAQTELKFYQKYVKPLTDGQNKRRMALHFYHLFRRLIHLLRNFSNVDYKELQLGSKDAVTVYQQSNNQHHHSHLHLSRHALRWLNRDAKTYLHTTKQSAHLEAKLVNEYEFDDVDYYADGQAKLLKLLKQRARAYDYLKRDLSSTCNVNRLTYRKIKRFCKNHCQF